MHIAPVSRAGLRRRFLDRPLALLPSRAMQIAELLQNDNDGWQSAAFDTMLEREESKPYDVIDGIAVIPIKGILVHEISFWGWFCGDETDYASIGAAMIAAVKDHAVKAIVMHVNSPGGEVNGCFDLADGIYGLRGAKPIWAIVDENAFSAAYALASAADRIVVPRTGGTGSIGVITMHVDITGALEKIGVKVTTIQFGARKSDSYPTTPLSNEARARLQAEANALGEMFVGIVARNRTLSAERIRATEAGCFLGADGVDIGLADAVMAPDAAFLALADSLR